MTITEAITIGEIILGTMLFTLAVLVLLTMIIALIKIIKGIINL